MTWHTSTNFVEITGWKRAKNFYKGKYWNYSKSRIFRSNFKSFELKFQLRITLSLVTRMREKMRRLKKFKSTHDRIIRSLWISNWPAISNWSNAYNILKWLSIDSQCQLYIYICSRERYIFRKQVRNFHLLALFNGRANNIASRSTRENTERSWLFNRVYEGRSRWKTACNEENRSILWNWRMLNRLRRNERRDNTHSPLSVDEKFSFRDSPRFFVFHSRTCQRIASNSYITSIAIILFAISTMKIPKEKERGKKRKFSYQYRIR